MLRRGERHIIEVNSLPSVMAPGWSNDWFSQLPSLFFAEGTLTAMGAWLALKMATYWNKPRDSGAEKGKRRTVDHFSSYGMLSLLSGLLSLFFAVLGGLVIRLSWGWGFPAPN